MDARRLELYELLKPTLGEEPAQALVLALPPDPEKLATKDDLAAMEARIDARFAQLETTLTRRAVTIMGAWTVMLGSAFAVAFSALG